MMKKKNPVTHAVGLSELESISIGDARDKWKREDNFFLRLPATLCMRLVLGGLSLDMMIVRRERTGTSFTMVFPR